MLLSFAAAAATLEVGQGQLYEQVGAAAAAAQDGDTILIHPGYYAEALVITQRELALESVAGSSLTVLQPPAGRRALTISGGVISVRGLSIEGGQEVRGGGVRVGEHATVDLNDVVIRGSSATWGGGIYVSQSSLTAANLHISGTQATLNGAGVYLDSASFSATDLVIQDALGDRSWGAGLSALASQVEVHGGVISGCHALRQADGYGGGGIYADSGSELLLESLVFSDNAAHSGGAIQLKGTSHAVLVDATFADNTALAAGGAIDTTVASSLSCTDCSFTGGLASTGGAIAGSLHATIELTASTFTKNTARSSGGALYGEQVATLRLTDVALADNTAALDGGAARVVGSSNTVVTGSAITGNAAGRDGGGWHESYGKATATFTRSVFTENEASGSGGAFMAVNNDSLQVVNCTLLGNSAGDGAHIGLEATPTTLVNDLLAFSAGTGEALAVDATSTVARSYLALWGNASGDWGPEWLSASPCIGCLSVDPLLVAWSDDGDPANDDLHPSRPSPLIDAGMPSTSDPDGTIADIGAFWSRPPSPWDDRPIDPTWPDDPVGPDNPPAVDPNKPDWPELGPHQPIDTTPPRDFAGGGCMGGGQASLLIAPLLMLLRRRRGLALFALPGVAAAGTPDVAGLHLVGGVGEVADYPNLVGTDTPPPGFALGVAGEYAATPLAERTETGRVPVIHNVAMGTLIASGTALHALRLEAALPVYGVSRSRSGYVGGTGDMRLGVEAALRPDHGLRPGLAIAGNVWLPTGAQDAALGHKDAAASLLVAVGHEGPHLGWTANAGARVAPGVEMRNLREGPGPLLGLGGRWSPTEDLSFTAELSVEGGHGWEQWPLTARGTVRHLSDAGQWWGVGLGAGLNEAVGTSLWSAQLVWGAGSRRPVVHAPLAPPDDPPAPLEVVEVMPAEEAALAALVDNRIVLRENLFFREGRHELLPVSVPTLEAIQEVLVDHEEVEYLLIQGHTNTNGGADVNLRLSQARAEVVLEWLVANGIDRRRLIAKGYGFEEPLVPRDHPDAERLNRRVEFLVVRPDEVPEDVRLPDEAELPTR